MTGEALRVGLIGAGMMGHGMALNILKAGHPVTVMAHRNRAPIDDLVRNGAAEAPDPALVAERSDVVILVLPNSAVVADVIEGERGLVAAGREGLVVGDVTTGDPSETIRLAGVMAQAGMALADVPVTRSPREAAEGRLISLLGGDADTLAALRPVLRCYSESLYEIGPLGSALKLKLINNLLSLGNAAVACEAAAAAMRSGVDLSKLHEIASQGGADSAMMRWIIGRLLEDDESGLRFTLRHARKDLACYNRMVGETGMPALLGDMVMQIYGLATALGHGDRFVGGLATILAEMKDAPDRD